MAKAKPIDVGLVKSLLEYAPELSGSCLRWKVDMTNGKNKINVTAGSMAGGLTERGYYRVTTGRLTYPAHRIVWVVVKGFDPVFDIDHIDGHKGNNRIENLRLAPRGSLDNAQNRKKNKRNTSGYTGVYLCSTHKKWRARLMVDGKRQHIGCFDTPEEAYSMYLKIKAELHTFNPTPREKGA